MNYYNVVGYVDTENCTEYCESCGNNEMEPIFAGTEMDRYPVCEECGTIISDITLTSHGVENEYGRYFEAGRDTGYDMARYGEFTEGTDRETAESECAEAEDNARQFSPFEVLAKEMNDSPDPDTAWGEYEDGVSQGIAEGLDERGIK